MGRYLLKASDEELDAWRGAAGSGSLAEWIRRTLNEGLALERAVAREEMPVRNMVTGLPSPPSRSFSPDFK